MPHAELCWSDDLDIDPVAMLQMVEDTILRHDDGAGACKGRAWPAHQYLHTHLKLTIALLAKPHRGAAFVAALQKDLTAALSPALPRPCWLSIDIVFSGSNYHTELLE